MGIDYFNLVLSGIVFFVYGAICGISIIFTFFLDIYLKIDERLNAYIMPSSVAAIFEINIKWLDDWCFNHNKIIGPILIVLSLIDLRLFFDIINKL